MSEDTPLLGETVTSSGLLFVNMVLCSIVHLVFLNWQRDALVDLLLYFFVCLLLCPLMYILFVPQSDKAFTYYVTGELGVRVGTGSAILLLVVVSFSLSFLISLAGI